ncbi:glycosyltransferase [Crateriforma conspicua]|uniref:glycosyltransferase n=1 Tax=Crateriforma conspicua TaxID=2527996 RepID=UPI00118794BF|nr:glycosyltransferase [Crateriforma conspicua]QDV65937.1 Putative glycosyltransferase EpsE [Crateriforma conspicua]
MSDQDQSPADNPLITFALISYNQEAFIRQAIEGAFAQTYSPLEILLSDDRSTDSTYDIMQEMAQSYTGPHTIRLNQNNVNLGIGGHVARISALAKGEWIIMAAGDDVSLPERAQAVADTYQRAPDTRAVFSDYAVISETSDILRPHVVHWPQKRKADLVDLCVRCGGFGTGSSFAYHKDVFMWPWTYPAHLKNEDRVLPLRAALLGKIEHVPKVHVRYRHVETSASRSEHWFLLSPENNSVHIRNHQKTIIAAAREKKIPQRAIRPLEAVRHLNRITFVKLHEQRNSRRTYRASLKVKLLGARLKSKSLQVYCRNLLCRI